MATPRMVKSKVTFTPKHEVGTIGTCCDICTGTSNPVGIVICNSGGMAVVDDYPLTGGPWALGIDPSGSFTWINVGAPAASKDG